MTEDAFWKIIEAAHERAPADMARKSARLEELLLQLVPAEIGEFDQHFTRQFIRAYTHDLWGAAHVIGNGCGDDKFMDFRSNLVSHGRQLFEQVLQDPDSLADWPLTKEQAFWEGFQYAASNAYQQLTGQELDGKTRHPSRPSGKAFKEWKMTARYPRLTARHQYSDKDWEYLKPKPDTWNRKFSYRTGEGREVKGSLSDLMLAGGIVTASGWIPPLKVTAQALRRGMAPSESGVICNWTGFELFEGDYWRAVVELERMKSEDIAHFPQINTLRLQHDVRFNRSEDFSDWLSSLQERGMLNAT